jgi:Vitamin K-dependent gamma-carboxylase
MTATVSPGVARRRSLLDEIVDARGDLRAVALMRALLGLIVVAHLWPDLTSDVTAVERFFAPWWSWLPVPSPALYRGLVWIGVAAGIAMAAGLAAHAATRVAFVVVAYLLVLDVTTFAHNRAFLTWLLFGLCFLPANAVVGVGTRRWATTTGPFWPVTMLRVVVSSVYLTSGLTKLANPDWRSGLVLWDRVVRHEQNIPFDGWIHDLVTNRAFHYVLSPGAIMVEVFVGLALWFPRTRLVAIWLALAFHTSIQVAASVQTFSFSAFAATLLWVTPSTRDRTLVASPGLAGVVRRLDWLHRFRVEAPRGGSNSTTVVDRDGTERHGTDARLFALSRLPLTFAFVAPLQACRLLGRLPSQR